MRQGVVLWFALALTMCMCTEVKKAPTETYYELMRVPNTATAKELRSAYRKMALEQHPDKGRTVFEKKLKQEKFIKLANAYEVLSDDRLRPRYDWLLAQGKKEYDNTIDWSNFDIKHGFPPGYQWSGSGTSFEAATATYDRAEAEAFKETIVLVVCFLAACCAGGYPFYISWQRKRRVAAQKKGAKMGLKEDQKVVSQLREEREAAEKQKKEENRAYQREMQEARKAVLAAGGQDADEDEEADGDAEADGEGDGDGDEGDDNGEGKPDEVKQKQAKQKKSTGAALAGAKFKCEVCNKAFKSQQQMDQHEASNKHKDAVKKAAGRQKKDKIQAGADKEDDDAAEALAEAMKKKNKKVQKKDKKKQQLIDIIETAESTDRDGCQGDDDSTDAASPSETAGSGAAAKAKKARRNQATKEQKRQERKKGGGGEHDDDETQSNQAPKDKKRRAQGADDDDDE